jgi:2-polyprenyl-6-methoxyphenol hydroxylase-like FAD-dependent oxidoreductase
MKPIVIAGAGPTGLTLACELARRGIAVRLFDAAHEPFAGSRGKGLQPRTLELLDHMGLAPQIIAAGGPYPGFYLHAGPLGTPFGSMSKTRAPTSDVPYPNIWMLPQWRTEAILRARFSELGGRVEYGTKLSTFAQDERGVSVTLSSDAGEQQLRAAYLIGCDGGHSAVRKALGVNFRGETLPAQPAVVADVELRGLDRTYWHVWPFAKGCVLTLCPLPGTASHQLAAPLRKGAPPPALDTPGIRQLVAAAVGA